MNRSFLPALLILVIATTIGCPGKKPPAQPVVVPQTETAPPTTTVTETAERVVEPPTQPFEQPPEPEVLSEDIDVVNERAQREGWIRDAYFAFDASTLDADAEAALTQSATWLRAHPELDLRIEGHTDERGTEQYNLALGDRRASAAMTYLETLGIPASRMSTVSFGEERPFEPGATEEAWAKNRRAHLVLVKRR